ncbi:MAG: EAL domain-containing protein [Gammaproteobacteria bacterium]|nr:EAL domain-containing protein [Gammaproteobacteria bacterium]
MYLTHFPVHALKIDCSFVSRISQGKKDLAIVKSTIDLAHNLGLKVVAEGVETNEQLQTLISMGCDELQGYLFSRPVSTIQFAKIIASGKYDISEIAKAKK